MAATKNELDLAHAAIDVDFGAGDVGGVGGRKEGDHAGNFFGFAEALHGNAGQDVFGKFIDGFLGEASAAKDRSFDGAGCNGVHSNIPWEQRSRDGARERTDRAFSGGVDRAVVHTLSVDHAAIENDGAAIAKMRKSLLYGEEQALGVDVKHFVVERFGGLLERSKLGDAGVGEENVDLAEFLRDGCIKAIEIGEIRNIRLHGQNAVADDLDSFVESL